MMENPVKQNDIPLYFLILRCQTGDDEAFEQLYECYHERTIRYLTGILDESSAWDIQQEVWLSVYMNISDLSNPGGFNTWLYQMTRNKAIDFIRKEKRESELLNSVSEEDEKNYPGENMDSVEINRVKELDSAIDQLGPRHREVIQLKYSEGMSYEEMALIIGCSIGTIRSRIYYAKQKLKQLLNE